MALLYAVRLGKMENCVAALQQMIEFMRPESWLPGEGVVLCLLRQGIARSGRNWSGQFGWLPSLMRARCPWLADTQGLMRQELDGK